MKKSKLHYSLLLISIICYVLIGYFTKREQFYQFIGLYAIVFTVFLLFYNSQKEKIRFSSILLVSIALRLILLFTIPNLSNDFYRFIWDGRLINLGLNPYLSLPNELINTDNFLLFGKDAQELYTGQGNLSPGNYSCYPPLNQLFFFIAAMLSPQSIYGSVIILRIFMILADVGTIIIGRKILRKLSLPESNIMLFALNPFIIIELTGNLHFEGVTIFFLMLAIYFLLNDKFQKSAIWMAISISVKLIPLIFIPLFLKKLGQRNTLRYLIITGIISILLIIPFLSSGLIENFMSSIDLYFRKFEFNASFYYVIRWIGFELKGWNIIQKVGPLLGLSVFVIVLLLSIIRRNDNPHILMVSMLFTISIYYFLSTTVHPWYIAIPLIFSVFTQYRFVVIWSFVVMLSYSAYGNESFKENYWLVFIEYLVVFSFLIFEILKSKSQPKPFRLNTG
ncbi:MAG: glycosyltransferase 87 family protein [Bacteroidales bacterium]|nr:glycosyltransferase 87 family protein [Bacteroidales bacterium]